MYAHKKFRGADDAMALEVIMENPFSRLISLNATGCIDASQLPVIVDTRSNLQAIRHGAWKSLILLGHMARANPQHVALDGADILLIFSSPHAYISPTWYNVTPSAPTWNYIDVHVRGRASVHDTAEETLHVLRESVRLLESSNSPPWSIEPSMQYVRQILNGVVSFKIDVKDVDYQFKLSQDKPEPMIDGVLDGLERSQNGMADDVARLMRRYLPILVDRESAKWRG